MFGRLSRKSQQDAGNRERSPWFTVGTKLFIVVYFVALGIVVYGQEHPEDFGNPEQVGNFAGAIAASFLASLFWLALPTFVAWLIWKSKGSVDKTAFIMVIFLFLAMCGGFVNPES